MISCSSGGGGDDDSDDNQSSSSTAYSFEQITTTTSSSWTSSSSKQFEQQEFSSSSQAESSSSQEPVDPYLAFKKAFDCYAYKGCDEYMNCTEVPCSMLTRDGKRNLVWGDSIVIQADDKKKQLIATDFLASMLIDEDKKACGLDAIDDINIEFPREYCLWQ